MERKIIKASLLMVVIVSPMLAYGIIDSSIRTNISTTGYTFDAVFLTLKDLWYPSDQETQIFPMLVAGTAEGIYRSPIVTLPSKVHVDVYAIDATNNTVDLSWIDVQSLHQLWDGKSVSVSYTPRVDGTFGETGIVYEAGVEYSESWIAQGEAEDISRTSFGGGLEETTNHTFLTSFELNFRLSVEDHSVVWMYLLGLKIGRSSAAAIEGHEINFMISYTYFWTDYLLGGLSLNEDKELDFYQNPTNLTLGNGETFGQWDCGTIYVLEGDIEFDILDS